MPTYEEAKKKFERERDKVLSEIPTAIKGRFGQIGFAYSESAEDFLPVLVLNPYDVPPKPVRDVYWYDMFSKGKRAKKLAQMSYLVYWYGSADPDDCYSFIEQDEYEEYAVGESKGYTKIPDAIQEKLDSNQSLTEEQEEKVRAINEMLEDLPKPPEERKRGFALTGFKERHEMLDDAPGDDDNDEEEAEGDDEDASKKRKRSAV